MSCTFQGIKHAFIRGQKDSDKPTHMLMVMDCFDYECYPVYTDTPNADVARLNGHDMQEVKEVYDLRKSFDSQSKGRVWNLPDADPTH